MTQGGIERPGAASVAGMTLEVFRARRELLDAQARLMKSLLGGQEFERLTAAEVAVATSVAELKE